MSDSIRIRATEEGSLIQLKALIKHPMETGNREDEQTGELIPAHYIQRVTIEANGEIVFRASWGPAVSRNPYLSVSFTGATKGDTVRVSWADSEGESDSQETEIQ